MPEENILAPAPFNPLDKRHLGESVASAMLKSPIHPLPPEKFKGAGIYAIYYTGDFEAIRTWLKSIAIICFPAPSMWGKRFLLAPGRAGLALEVTPAPRFIKGLMNILSP